MDLVDQLMFQALANLYGRFYGKQISKEAAATEKKELLRNYEHWKFMWSMGDHWAAMLKGTEMARTEYRKNPTLENADKLLAAIDGLPTGWREKRGEMDTV